MRTVASEGSGGRVTFEVGCCSHAAAVRALIDRSIESSLPLCRSTSRLASQRASATTQHLTAAYTRSCSYRAVSPASAGRSHAVLAVAASPAPNSRATCETVLFCSSRTSVPLANRPHLCVALLADAECR